MSDFSVVIICKNEAKNIERCVKSALKVATDVVVVDSYSTDETKKICSSLPVNFIQQEWLGYGAQKNFGASIATNNWILSIDADEWVSSSLISNLKTWIAPNNTIVYSFKRSNRYCGKAIRFGVWGKDKVHRLYNKNAVEWNKNEVHEKLIGIKESISFDTISGVLHHESYTSKSEYKNRSLHYALLAAKELKSKGAQFNILTALVKSFFKFFKEYIILLGMLDGKLGWEIALMNARMTYRKYDLIKTINKTL